MSRGMAVRALCKGVLNDDCEPLRLANALKPGQARVDRRSMGAAPNACFGPRHASSGRRFNKGCINLTICDKPRTTPRFARIRRGRSLILYVISADTLQKK